MAEQQQKFLDNLNGLPALWNRIKEFFALKTDIPTNNNQLTNGAGYQTSSQVETIVAGKGYQTSTQVESAITSKGYQTADQVNTAITSKGYQTESQVNSIVTGKGYQTAKQVEDAINSAITTAVKYKGTVSSESELPTDANIGDLWNISSASTYGAAGTGLSLSGTTFNHSNSVTAGTAQGDASKTLAFGGTFTIPTVTYDAQGHVTGKGTTTMTMPANPNTDTKNTAGSTDTSNKIFLVGTTSQAANPQTYSDNQVYATNGQLNGNSIRIAESVTLQYDSNTEAINFVFG